MAERLPCERMVKSLQQFGTAAQRSFDEGWRNEEHFADAVRMLLEDTVVHLRASGHQVGMPAFESKAVWTDLIRMNARARETKAEKLALVFSQRKVCFGVQLWFIRTFGAAGVGSGLWTLILSLTEEASDADLEPVATDSARWASRR